MPRLHQYHTTTRDDPLWKRAADWIACRQCRSVLKGKTHKTCKVLWIQIRFRCVYIPSGNGIVERSHRTMKHIAVRIQCSLTEAVYWHNMTPKDDTTASIAPVNLIYTYHTHMKSIDTPSLLDTIDSCAYTTRDDVWVKRLHKQCTTQFKKGRMTNVYSPHSILVNGVPHYVKGVCPVHGAETTSNHINTSDEETSMLYEDQMWEDTTISTKSASSMLKWDEFSNMSEENTTEEIAERTLLRQRIRIKWPVLHAHLCDPQVREGSNCCEQNMRHHTHSWKDCHIHVKASITKSVMFYYTATYV